MFDEKISCERITIKIGEETLKKLRYIAFYENFHLNAQMILFLQKGINEFEGEHGRIDVHKSENENTPK